MSHAAEMAAGKLAALRPGGARAFVDDSHFKGDGADYAVAAIRAALLQRGLILVGARPESQIVIEPRLGALSIDQKDVILGLPAISLPVPGTLTAVALPELSLYSQTNRKGVAEFAAIAYDTQSGHPIAIAGPVGGERLLRQTRVLTVFGSGGREEAPGVIDGKR
jgi:hypothetical protein